MTMNIKKKNKQLCKQFFVNLGESTVTTQLVKVWILNVEIQSSNPDPGNLVMVSDFI